MNRIYAGLAVALALIPALALAQETPEERAWQEQILRAQDSTQGAYDALVRLPIDLEAGGDYPLAWLRTVARRQLGLEAEVVPEPFRHEEARAYLLGLKQELLERLAQLDPSRQETASEEEPERDPPQAVLRIYDVQDLARYEGYDYPTGPSLGVATPYQQAGGSMGGVLTFCDNDDGQLGACVDPDSLIEALEEELYCESEDLEGSLEYSSGRLIVHYPQAAQDTIARCLAELRRQRGGLVELDVRVYAVSPAVHAGLRDAAADGLDASEEALLKGAKLVARHRVVAWDGQQVSVEQLKTTNYQGDLEVNQTGVIPVLNPVVNQLHEGLTVQVRPLVERRSGRVMLEVRAALAKSEADWEERVVKDHQLALPRTRLTRILGLTTVQLGQSALIGGTLTRGQPDEFDVVIFVRPRLIQGGAR